MNKREVVRTILGSREIVPALSQAKAFAPSNIALCKYWGKRCNELNLPQTSSLSISLDDKGAHCTVQLAESAQDIFRLNGQVVAAHSAFSLRLAAYLDLFRASDMYFAVDMQMNIPMAAGLASSACGFASLILALNDFFAWDLTLRELSILARLGSGSACRSIFNGFVEWQAGEQADGMDSFADVFAEKWPELRVGIYLISESPKAISSRVAMERTVATSQLYAAWPQQVKQDLQSLKKAIMGRDFHHLAATAEKNALSMHALMMSSWPPVVYHLPQTIAAMQKIWHLREQGLGVYFTQDAGPNLKLLYLAKDEAEVKRVIPMGLS